MVYVSWMSELGAKLDAPLMKAASDCYTRGGRWPLPARWSRRLLERFSLLPVIIQMTDALGDEHMQLMKKCKVRIRHRHEELGVVSGRIRLSALRQLCRHAGVSRIHMDREVRALLDTAAPSVGAIDAQTSGYTGIGVTIAVIDTGIYPHPDLTRPVNRIAGFKDFVNGRTTAYDDNGHGTHVAGDAAGNGYQSDGRYRGPAPKARLVGVKVLDRQGSGSLSTVIAGIDWCIRNRDRYGIRIISMSLGAPAVSSYKDDPVCRAVEAAERAGIVVVAAAGNDGPGRSTIASPGISPYAITVGADDDRSTTATGDDTIAPFSSRGPTIDGLTKPDVVSPGVNVVSLRSPRSYLDGVESNARVGKWYFNLSGTSMAAPLVAGTIAQLLQANSALTPEQVKQLLVTKAVNLGFDANEQGGGEANVRFLAT